MPIFEYQCLTCDRQFEQIVREDSAVMECPSCGEEATKLFSTFAVAVGSRQSASNESGPCHCGAPRRGMCSE